MECIEARALKPSFLSQMAAKTNSPVFYDDDFWCLAGINGASSDDFPVEDLLNLDFPEKECFSREDDEEKVELVRNSNNSSSTFSGADKFDSLSTGGIPVPVGELEKLEWLSQFIDDSTAELSLLCPTGSFTETGWFHHDARVEPACGPVPKKRRSKRSRARRRPWCLASPPLSAAESSSTSSSYSSLASPLLLFTKPAAQKQKKKPEADDGSVSGRRCAHCQVQKTPQWRTGPLGPKTLCNACGVRFKSGRLFPEYRPACSPTFSHEMHSNSHQKVLEMRRKREMAQVG